MGSEFIMVWDLGETNHVDRCNFYNASGNKVQTLGFLWIYPYKNKPLLYSDKPCSFQATSSTRSSH